MEIEQNKNIVLYDNISSGHHSTCMFIYAKMFLELNYNVWIFYPEIDHFYTLKEKYAESLTLNKISKKEFIPLKNKYFNIVYSFMRCLGLWVQARENIMLKIIKPDLVFFLWIDSYLNPLLNSFVLDIFFKLNWAGIYFHPWELRIYQKNSIIGRHFKRYNLFKSSYCKFICVMDENIANNLEKLTNKKTITVPDNTYEEEDYVDHFQIKTLAKERRIIGLIGSLEKRKGLLTTIETAEILDSDRFYFVIAGELADSTFNALELTKIKAFLQKNRENCFLYLKKIPDDTTFNSLISTCDIILCVYENFPHSSGIMTKASFFKKPIITSDRYLMAERTIKYNLGICVKEKNPDQLSKAIIKLSDKLNKKLFHGKFEDYNKTHSYNRLKKIFFELKT